MEASPGSRLLLGLFPQSFEVGTMDSRNIGKGCK